MKIRYRKPRIAILIISTLLYHLANGQGLPQAIISYERVTPEREHMFAKDLPSPDSLYLYFLERFKQDEVKVLLNDKVVYSRIISSDTIISLGRADFFNVRKGNTNFIKFIINNEVIEAFLKDDMNVIQVYKGYNKLNPNAISIVFRNRFSFYE